MTETDYVLSEVTVKILEEGLWEMLVEAGEWKLMEKLRASLKFDYRVMITPRGGFSANDEIHNTVLTWLRARGIMVYNPENEVMLLESSLRDGIKSAKTARRFLCNSL